jgi:hypothetical protein
MKEGVAVEHGGLKDYIVSYDVVTAKSGTKGGIYVRSWGA